MKSLRVARTPHSFEEKQRTPEVVTAYNIIEESAYIYEGDTLVGVYLHDVMKASTASSMLSKIKYTHGPRNSGMIADARIFGYGCRDYIRCRPCRRTSLHKDQPQYANTLENIAGVISSNFQKYMPEAYDRQLELLNEKVHPAYRMRNSCYTSGIVNNSNELRYHTDRGNIHGTTSALLTYRNGIIGGYIHIPEYSLLIKNGDGSLLLFDGAQTLHGVTRFHKNSDQSYRYTIVYYCMEQLKQCLPPLEEIEYFNRKDANKYKGKDESIYTV